MARRAAGRKSPVLDAVRRKRGYLLSYHQLLHAIRPELLEAYDAFYKRLIAKVELSDVTSMFAMEEIKSTTRIPLNYLPD